MRKADIIQAILEWDIILILFLWGDRLDLEELKLFLRIDTEEEDALIQGLQLSAEEYLLNAGVTKD